MHLSLSFLTWICFYAIIGSVRQLVVILEIVLKILLGEFGDEYYLLDQYTYRVL